METQLGNLPPQQENQDQNSCYSFDEEQLEAESIPQEEELSEQIAEKPKRRSKKTEKVAQQDEDIHQNIYDEKLYIDKLPKDLGRLQDQLEIVEAKLKKYTKQFIKQTIQNQTKQSFVTPDAIPICADIRKFDFTLLRQKQLEFGQHLFDIIMMDPPWKLSSSNPSRGVAIQYDSLGDDCISKIPVPQLQDEGFLCIWTINAKYRFSCKLMQQWGYRLVDEITWVKKTVNGKIAKGHGFYLQHAKQSCLIGVKGDIKNPRFNFNASSDIIFSQRRGQSQKPTETYEILERLVPNGFYLQIFGRRNNLRDKWVTIGNEL